MYCNMDPPDTPLPPSNSNGFLSPPNSRGSTSSFRFRESTPSSTPRRPTALSMIPPPPPPIPNQLVQNRIAIRATPQPSPPDQIDLISETSPIQLPARAADTIAESIDFTEETNEAAAVDAEATIDDAEAADVADEDAGILDANIAQFLPAQGEGEPIEEVPIRHGRSFRHRQCMWIAQEWYRATEDSVRGANMTSTDFQKKVGDIYEAYRLEFVEEQVSEGEMTQDQVLILYKQRTNKSIYCKWLTIQRSVLDFIAYIKTRGNRPSGISSDLDWLKVLRASFVDLKNARFRLMKKRDKFCCPGLIDLHDFLM